MAFERYFNCYEIQGVKQNRISKIVRTLEEIKMSKMDRIESNEVPMGIATDEALSTSKERVIFKNTSIILERSIFKSSEIEEESSEFSGDSGTLLISPAINGGREYLEVYEGLTESSSYLTSSVTTKATIKLIRDAFDQYSDMKNFYEKLSPEFDHVNIEAANKKCCFSAKEIKKYINGKVKLFGKKEKDPMNTMLDADEVRRKPEHLTSEKRKDKQKKKPNWKPLTRCCKQDDVVASHKRKTRSKPLHTV
ncbi:hypothetical protein L6164_012085 [Bauhinia variegata]|uniref:Uncharacterized protein n=1 Tax=Bauhinia variegata TaxID=167791 RepID=A0ACB9P8D1_BAUVA|nr:hypothetical protein L6164_012085 [Bauhinia variegata]